MNLNRKFMNLKSFPILDNNVNINMINIVQQTTTIYLSKY